MDSYITTLLIVCPLVFIAGFIDSIAGGGGIISIPAYLFAGLPIQTAYGTNKFTACFGTAAATAKYLKSGYVRFRVAGIAAAGALVGSWCGARLVILLDEAFLRWSLLIILPAAAIFLTFNKGFGKQERAEVTGTRADLLSLAIGLVIGAYDGFFGPGTGTFLVLAFTGLMGLSLTSATGNAKVINLASNIAALSVYVMNGNVLYSVGLPAVLCSVAGNYLGARLAVQKGARFIRPVILTAVGLLFVKIIWDIVSGL